MKMIKKEIFIVILIIFIASLFCAATVSASTITVTAKPSADCQLPYKDFTKTWENYCPLCGQSETLEFNPKNTFEGELTCSCCGADYCGVTGKDKHCCGSRADLTPFKNNSSINNTIKNNSFTNYILESLFFEKLNLNIYSQTSFL